MMTMSIPSSERTWHDTIPFIEKGLGDELAKANPRTYRTVPEYHSSRDIAYRLTLSNANRRDRQILRENNFAMLLDGAVSDLVVKNGVQTWWIGKDLVESLQRTSPLENLLLCDIPKPFDAFLLLLPLGAVISPAGYPVQMIKVAWVTPPQLTEYKLTSSEQAIREHGALAIVFAESRNTIATNTYYNWQHLQATAKEWNLNQETIEIFGEESEVVDGDIEFTRNVARIAINATCLITEYRELVEPSAVEKRIKARAGGGKIDLWSPRWLGRPFKKAMGSTSSSTGTHASPRLH